MSSWSVMKSVQGMLKSWSNLTVVEMVARSPVVGSGGAMETSWQESPSKLEMSAEGAL